MWTLRWNKFKTPIIIFIYLFIEFKCFEFLRHVNHCSHTVIRLVSSDTEVVEVQKKCRDPLFFILCIVSGPAGSQVLHYNKYYEKEIHDTEVFVAQGSDHKNVEKSFLFSYFLAPKQKN